MSDDEPDPARAHSAEYFGDDRDYFWNADYLDLTAKRLGLGSVTCAADIGCGIGHWSALLFPRLAPGATLVGVEREARHVAGFRERIDRLFPGNPNITVVEGDAGRLPLPDAAYDLATCQTLLLHLPDPRAALREMIRVTKPGGLILCVEPNNMIGGMPFSGMMDQRDPESLIRQSEFAWRHSLGRVRRGFGKDFIGELLPGMFAEFGLEQIQLWLGDRPGPLIPPYSDPSEQATLRAAAEWEAAGVGPFETEEIRANVLAGGGTEAFFQTVWAESDKEQRIMADALKEGRWSSAGGVLFYIIAGRVPG